MGSENKPSTDGSICGHDPPHRLLSSSLEPHVFQEVSRLLLGLNCGRPLKELDLPQPVLGLSSKHDFDLQAFSFQAEELLRKARVGLIQNSIAVPTSAGFDVQMKVIFEKLRPMIEYSC